MSIQSSNSTHDSNITRRRSFLCQEAMRDPITVVYTFLGSAGQSSLRQTCGLMFRCFNCALYWELPLGGTFAAFPASASSSSSSSTSQGVRVFPVNLQRTVPYLSSERPGQSEITKVKFCGLSGVLASIPALADCQLLSEKLPSPLTAAEGEEENGPLLIASCPPRPPQPPIAAGAKEREGTTTAPTGSERIKLSFIPKEMILAVGRADGDLVMCGEKDARSNVADVASSQLPPAGFLLGSTQVDSLTICHLPKTKFTTNFGKSWLCSLDLVRVVITDLPFLESVESRWLFECKCLTSVEFSNLPLLGQVGREWMRGCHNLRHAKFTKLQTLREIDTYGFMQDCKMRLMQVDMDISSCHTTLVNEIQRISAAAIAKPF